MIEVENLTKSYGKHMALKGVSFQLEKGKIYGFLGPNGAGKSTTMNIMTGYIAPTDGTVCIDGHDIIKDAQEAKKCIGYLPEIPPIYPDMTVWECLQFAAEIKKVPKSEREGQIQDIMELTGIGDIGSRLIKNLSKGYKQRVGLAQAVLGYPDIIILDEPTVGLDPKQIIEIRQLIRKLGEKHTVILSSHILSEVQAVCDEILILSKGEIVAEGTTQELIAMMHKDVILEIELEADRKKLTELLDSFEMLESYEWVDTADEKIQKVKIHTPAEVDIRKELFYRLAEEKMPIMSLQRMEDSLEDVFLELTDTLTEDNGKNVEATKAQEEGVDKDDSSL